VGPQSDSDRVPLTRDMLDLRAPLFPDWHSQDRPGTPARCGPREQVEQIRVGVQVNRNTKDRTCHALRTC